MALIFARHGHTFESHQTPVMVGAKQDIPLTSFGEAQARDVGAALRADGITLARVVASPLKRASRFADLAAIAADYDGPIAHDPRLVEIDYGDWGGLSDAAIIARFGPDDLEAWRQTGTRPAFAGWQPHEDVIRADMAALCADLSSQPGHSLIVTSNGVLRYLLELVPDAWEARRFDGSFRVKTGNICVLKPVSGGYACNIWNAPPKPGLFAEL